MVPQADNFSHLDAAGRGVAALARHPRWPVYACVMLACVVSWALLVVMAAEAGRTGGPAVIGPGAEWLSALPQLPLPDGLIRFIGSCMGPFSTPASLGNWVLITVMWGLMSVATMLPSAAPMLRTYCEIADTAAAKQARAVHPLVLVAGYLAVWLIASGVFAGLTVTAQQLGGATRLGPLQAWPAALALMLAGLYQFSSLKEACLEKCRNPFATLFARWTTQLPAIFRLGVELGLWCLGCCWALMLVMFAVGVMNVFWMALIAVFTLFEKEVGGRLSSRISGAILLVWGAAVLLVLR